MTVKPDTSVLNAPEIKLAAVPETVPVTVKLPVVAAAIAASPETVILVSTPPLVKVIVSTLSSPYGILLYKFFF
jgi:hypothetical protein